MKYHVILNACQNTYQKQLREMQGFISEYCSHIEAGYTIIICNQNADKAKLAEMAPTTSVIFAIVNHYYSEAILHALEKILNRDDIYLFGNDFTGIELAVRSGKRMNGSSIIGAMNMHIREAQLIVSKMVYSNHMQGDFLLEKAPYCISIARGMEEKELQYEVSEIVQEIVINDAQLGSFVVSTEFAEETKRDGFENAKLLVVAGRGIRNKQAAEELKVITERIHGELGVSRPVAMNAWMPMDRLVGVSGAMLKPDICITTGISGAPALYAGIEKSQIIIAINTDEKAPIMKKADVVIVDDYKCIMEALADCMEAEECDG